MSRSSRSAALSVGNAWGVVVASSSSDSGVSDSEVWSGMPRMELMSAMIGTIAGMGGSKAAPGVAGAVPLSVRRETMVLCDVAFWGVTKTIAVHGWARLGMGRPIVALGKAEDVSIPGTVKTTLASLEARLLAVWDVARIIAVHGAPRSAAAARGPMLLSSMTMLLAGCA